MSYVTLFIVGKVYIVAKILDQSFILSTQLGYSMISKRMYRGCAIEIIDYHTTVYLVKLEIFHFDIIIGMDLLASYHANAEYRTNMIIIFHFPGRRFGN